MTEQRKAAIDKAAQAICMCFSGDPHLPRRVYERWSKEAEAALASVGHFELVEAARDYVYAVEHGTLGGGLQHRRLDDSEQCDPPVEWQTLLAALKEVAPDA